MERIERLEKDFDPGTCLVRWRGGKASPRASFAFANLLLERDGPGDRDRACRVLDAVLETPLLEPSWERGRFPMLIEEEWRDLNSNLFLMPDLIGILASHLDKLPARPTGAWGDALAGRCETAGRLAVEFAERRWDDEVFDLHRDFKAYSNIFVLCIQFLLLAGTHYEDERLLRNAEAQWRRWFDQIAYYGIDECASPTYNAVVYEGLLRTHDLTRNERTRAEVCLVLDHLTTLQYAIAHPTLGMPLCGASRDYRQFRPPGAVAEEYGNRTFPHAARGRATAVPFRFKSWQDEHSGQQINLPAAVGRSPTERAVAFIPGGVGWNTTSGYVRQRGSQALCVFARLPNSYYRTQVVTADAEIPSADRHPHGLGLTDGWREEANGVGRLVLSAYGHVLSLSPFVLSDDEIVPIMLERAATKDAYSGAKSSGYSFPEDAQWFGCLVSLLPEGGSAPEPEMDCYRSDREVEVAAAGGLSIRLFLQPSGELTELHEEDWRTTPLLDCPTGVLWPGQLAERAAIQNSGPG